MNATAFVMMLVSTCIPTYAQTVSLKQKDGTFRTDIWLNNQLFSSAIIDTGSTSVIVCQQMATELGLPVGAPVRLETIAQPAAAHRTRISLLRIGPIEFRNVDALVLVDAPSCDEAVIGLSLLRRLGCMTLRGDTLTLSGNAERDFHCGQLRPAARRSRGRRGR